MITHYQLLYQITPIFLKGGIVAASNINNMVPVLGIIDPVAFDQTMVNGNLNWNMDDSFAIFQPAPGGTLLEQTIAEYPFANLSVAANAIVRNPINLSMIMMTPMKQAQAWNAKKSKMTQLKMSLDSHNNLGGTYVIFTPAFTYIDMCITALTDISTTQSPLPQNTWRWDFTRPLVQLAELQAVYNNQMNQIEQSLPAGVSTLGAITGPALPGSIPPNTFGGPSSANSLVGITSSGILQ